MKVAVGQAVVTSGDLAGNVVLAARLTHEAGVRGAELLVLGEAFLTGYDPAAFSGDVPRADDLSSEWSQPLRAACSESGTTLVVSTPLARGERRTLSTLVVTRDGAVTAPYDKQHLDDLESEFFTPGTTGAVVEVGGARVGLSICRDSMFPDHARAAADAGAGVWANCSAWFPGGERRREIRHAARALDNAMVAVCGALVGPCGRFDFIGGSAVYDTAGRPLVNLGTSEGVAVVEV